MNTFYWKSYPNSITISNEGKTNSAIRFVDSDYGSDIQGDGSRQRPFSTLPYAYFYGTVRPTSIICRGYFCDEGSNVEQNANGLNRGNHSGAGIYGDYLGAAVYDGGNRNIIFGFQLGRMIVDNCAQGSLGTFSVNGQQGAACGLGRANAANGVNLAYYVYGVTSPTCVLTRSPLYLGVAGSTNGNSYPSQITYSKPKRSPSYGVSLGSGAYSTYYDCQIEKMGKIVSALPKPINHGLFAKWDMFGNESQNITFEQCVFGADCKWYKDDLTTFFEFSLDAANEYLNTEYESVAEMSKQEYSAEFERQLQAWRAASNYTKVLTFTDCIFSRQTAEELMNNPEDNDFTLRVGSDAQLRCDEYGEECAGMFGTHLYIPVIGNGKSGSNGHIECWDNETADGGISVEDGKIIYDTVNNLGGSIETKIIKTDPISKPITGIWGMYNKGLGAKNATDFHFSRHKLHTDATPALHDEARLEAGAYIIEAGSGCTINIYNASNDEELEPVHIERGHAVFIEVGQYGIVHSDEHAAISIYKMEDEAQNLMRDVVYCRCRAEIYEHHTSGNLEAGATYYNDNEESIYYAGREVVSGESFVCRSETGNTFTGAESVGLMFRADEDFWVPAYMQGDYFVLKSHGSIATDEAGNPYSSAHLHAYNGYNQVNTALGYKTVLNQPYVQFKIVITSLTNGNE